MTLIEQIFTDRIIVGLRIRTLKSRRDADIIGRVRRPCVIIPHKPKPRRGDNQLDEQFNPNNAVDL